MSDRDLRVLERAVKADKDDTAAAVALLTARVRAGFVPQERVDLAARLGDEAAMACSALDRARLDWTRHEDRVTALWPLSHRVVVGLACGWAEIALPVWEGAYPDDSRPRLAIEAARAWLAEPSAEAIKNCEVAAWNTNTAIWAVWGSSQGQLRYSRGDPEWTSAEQAAFSAWAAATSVSSRTDPMRRSPADAAASGSVWCVLSRGGVPGGPDYAGCCGDVIAALLTPKDLT